MLSTTNSASAAAPPLVSTLTPGPPWMHHHMARAVASKLGERTMGKTAALILGVLLLAAAPVFAADVDGKWTGTMSTPGGDFPVSFVFKADGAKLTGTMIGMEGMELPITNGKIEGDKIAYTVNIDFGGMMLELIYKGVVTASEIKLDMSVFDMPFELVVKKEK
jgi:hypothetical protein